MGRSVDPFHDDPVVVLILEDVEDLDDGWMANSGNGAGLAAKSSTGPRVAGVFDADFLERYGAIEARIIGFEHLAHATTAQELFNPVWLGHLDSTTLKKSG